MRKTIVLCCLVALSCGGDEPNSGSSFTSAATIGSASASATQGTGSSGGDTDAAGSSSDGDVSTSGVPKLDVGAAETGGASCTPDNLCCNEELPPHTLLDAFLAAYPPANMPKSVDAIQAFMPIANGHAMAWSDENVGGELVDVDNGGVIQANIITGRSLSRMAAESTLPAGTTVIDVREDPVVIEDLGGAGTCLGVGWAWGSLLLQNVDESISERVYLYIGFCNAGDIEVFYYSDESALICDAPG